MAFYSRDELQSLGLAQYGEDVYISKKSSIYNPGKISIGNHVRIDDFCVLSAGEGGIEICNYVHIAVFCSLIGSSKIKISDFGNLSSRVAVYSSNDDYTGEYMSNPMVSEDFTGVFCDDVIIEEHVIIGTGAVVLPGVVLGKGVSVGALSLVKDKCESFGIYAGVPAKRVGDRKQNLLELEQKFHQENMGSQS